MWYAVIAICAVNLLQADGECDPKTSVYAMESPSVFLSKERCNKSATDYLYEHIKDAVAEMDEKEKYKITMYCKLEDN